MVGSMAETGAALPLAVSDGVKFGVTVFSVLVAAAAIWINGYRNDRARRRELYAEGLAAVVEYREFAFAIRRRDGSNRASERVRLSTALSATQAKLARCEVLIENERSVAVAKTYRELVAETRKIAGAIIASSWNADPITADAEMHAPEIAKELAETKGVESAFIEAVKKDLKWWKVV